MANRRVNVSINARGFDDATNKLRAFRKELMRLDGASATVKVNVVGESPANKSMIVDRAFVERSLVEAMRLSPSMLSDYVNKGRILPDKMAMFIANLQRELMREGVRQGGAKKVLRNRDQFIEHHGLKFLYFKSDIGKHLNKPATDALNEALPK